MNKKLVTLFSVLFLIVVVLAACGNDGDSSSGDSGSAEEKVTLRLAHILAENHPVHISMEKFAELVQEKTDGTVEIEIFANGTLGSEREYLESLQSGTLDIAKVSVSAIENSEKKWGIFSIPYLFADAEHGNKYMNSEAVEELYTSTVDSLDILGLTWYDAGSRNYYTSDTPIEKPEDMTGLLMRVQGSEILMEAVEILGGSATPLDFGELYTAIQQGVVDGAGNGIVAFSDNNLGEVAKHFSFTQHTFTPDVLIIKNSVFEGLTSEQQAAVKEAALESTAFHTENWETSREEATKKAEDAGVTMYYPDLEPFAEALQPIKDRFMNGDEEIAELIKVIDEMK